MMRAMPRLRPTTLSCGLSVLASLLLGCGSTEDPSGEHAAVGPRSIYVVPASLEELHDEGFFDHPWPSDLRLEDGSPRFEGYYNPRAVPLLDEYITTMKGQLDGFSPVAAGYVRFSTALDPATLPVDPPSALEPDASVQLLDVDPTSDELGQRKLISLRFDADERVYIRDNTLSFMPVLGSPLRPRTRYALVVTDGVRSTAGEAILPSAALSEVLGVASSTRSETASAREALAPTLAELERAGIDKTRIVQLAVFTTTDPAAELFAARDDLRANVPAPTLRPDGLALHQTTADFDEYTGEYGPSPNYQEGKLPFKQYGDGGAFKHKDGHPTVVDLFDARFSLTVPRAASCPMPSGGYPIVLYAHGTGGDYRSYVRDGTAGALARRCLASMGVDQIFHGTRPGADAASVELLFFNFQNIAAARYNGRQSALDEVQRARLFTESGARVPASVSTTGADLLFDGTKLMFFGHSQGGLNGPLYLAADDSARGGVLSGSSSLIQITLLEKTKPSPSVAALVKTVFLALNGDEGDELSVFHPALSLAQTIVDPVDPVHYARYDQRSPRPGFAAKSIYMTEGINPDGTGDSYAPPHGIEVQALAMGLPLMLPAVRPIAEGAWGGPAPVAIPKAGLSGNLGAGTASGVLAQWAVPPGEDGHFVIFDVPAARDQAAGFLRNLADDPKGRVPAP
jgi:hypothetical protein